jgi:hypothetical protein
MSLFDWVGAAGAAGKPWEAFEATFPGTFGVTFGDALVSVVFGAQHNHIYGDTIRYTVDVEGFLFDGVLSKIPGLGGLLEAGGGALPGLVAGVGGFANFVFGNNSSVIYGPNTTVHRGPLTAITGNSPTFGGGKAVLPDAGKTGVQGLVDRNVQAITSVLSLLMVGAGLTVEVLAATKFKAAPPLPSTATPDQQEQYKQEEEPKEKMRGVMKLLAIGLTNRLMALTLAAERFSDHARKAAANLPTIEQRLAAVEGTVPDLSTFLSAVGGAVQANLAGTALLAQNTGAQLKQAADDLAGLTGGATPAVRTSDLANLTTANFVVLADGDVAVTSQGKGAEVRVAADGQDGTLTLAGAGTASLGCGPVSVALANPTAGTPNLALKAGATGTVDVVAGVVDVNSLVKLTPTGVTLRFGPPDLGTIIELSAEGIKMSVAGGFSSLTITPAGISLKVGEGVTALNLTPALISETVAEVTERMASAAGHVLSTAEGESQLMVSAAGLTYEGPLVDVTAEAGLNITTALKEVIAEAMSSSTAAIVEVV